MYFVYVVVVDYFLYCVFEKFEVFLVNVNGKSKVYIWFYLEIIGKLWNKIDIGIFIVIVLGRG